MAESSNASVLTVALLIGGGAVGAGILGLPVTTGMAGAIPAAAAMVLVWIFMMATGRIMLRRMTETGDSQIDYGTLYGRDLGRFGLILAAFGYLINLYGSLVAYLSASATTLSALFDAPHLHHGFLIAFFVLGTGLAVFGLTIVRRGNTLVMVCLIVAFFFLLFQAFNRVEPERFDYADWAFLPSILPVTVMAFTYQVVIPNAARSLDMDFKRTWRAVFWGGTFILLFNLSWTLGVVGALPLTGDGGASLWAAFQKQDPATVPLAKAIGSPAVNRVGLMFTICAVLTSYLALGSSLMAFLKDLLAPVLPVWNKPIETGLAFGPPLLVAWFFPNVFLQALNVSGGLGVGIIFGLLPALVFLKKTRLRLGPASAWGLAILIFFTTMIALELAQELGMLQIHPQVEYHTIGH